MSDLEKAKENGLALRYIENQTEAICLAAAKKDYQDLHYVQPNFFKMAVNTLRLKSDL